MEETIASMLVALMGLILFHSFYAGYSHWWALLPLGMIIAAFLIFVIGMCLWGGAMILAQWITGR